MRCNYNPVHAKCSPKPLLGSRYIGYIYEECKTSLTVELVIQNHNLIKVYIIGFPQTLFKRQNHIDTPSQNLIDTPSQNLLGCVSWTRKTY